MRKNRTKAGGKCRVISRLIALSSKIRRLKFKVISTSAVLQGKLVEPIISLSIWKVEVDFTEQKMSCTTVPGVKHS